MKDVIGFVKAVGKKLINGKGQEILLRGVGFGSWMLPEGYMWRFPTQGDRPRKIEKLVSELIGEKKALEFWDIYRQNYISEEDIKKIAEEGFNSVRLPINSRNILKSIEPIMLDETVMCHVDRVIDWCRKYELYVIWDLHGAPGGQTGTNIDDSEFDKPELFMNEKNHKITVELWRSLADRYKDEWIIAGYDLLNEPLPNWNSDYNYKVLPLYKDIVNAIREVDKNHMIILEGVHWSTDWSIFTEIIDDNIMLQFHKYWNNPDTESIQIYLDMREKLNVPIFMGEGGENNIHWYAGAFQLFEEHNISWNLWTWKKINTTNSPCSVKMPEGWNKLIKYLQYGEKPDKETAETILWDYLVNLHFKNCDYNSEVAGSLFRRPPVEIPAIFYGYRGRGLDFETSIPSQCNLGFRVNDDVKFSFVEGSRETAHFQHGGGEAWAADEWICLHINPGDWFSYAFTIDSADMNVFSLSLCVCAPVGDSILAISIDDMPADTIEVKGRSWITVTLDKKIMIGSGKHRIVIKPQNSITLVKLLEIL